MGPRTTPVSATMTAPTMLNSPSTTPSTWTTPSPSTVPLMVTPWVIRVLATFWGGGRLSWGFSPSTAMGYCVSVL